MRGMLGWSRRVVAIGLILTAGAGASSAQVVVAPEPAARGGGLRSLGREFVDQLRYPFRAVPEAFTPDPPPRVVLRPRFDGTTEAVTVGPRPIRPLYISGYAGAPRPAPLVPTARSLGHGHGPFGRPSHHHGR